MLRLCARFDPPVLGFNNPSLPDMVVLPEAAERLWMDMECPTPVILDWLEEHAASIPGATAAQVEALVAYYRKLIAANVAVVE